MTLTNIAFVIPGPPQGKGRARATKTGRMYTPAKTVAYESLVALSAVNAMGPARPLIGPVAVEIEAVATTPASWSKKRASEAIWWESKPDIDNVVKAVADGANGIVWVDDRQIVRLLVEKRYGPRAEVRVRVAVL